MSGLEVMGGCPRIHSTADITGNGLPEIVWSVSEMGAHTVTTTVSVIGWNGRSMDCIDGDARMFGVERIVIGHGWIELDGGIIGSVGAGIAQRSRTDRYRYDGSGIVLVAREFERSPFSYHRLQDGIVAESLGCVETALSAYREAAEDDREAGPDELVEDPQRKQFNDAVRTFARFRLARLLIGEDRWEETATILDADTGMFTGLLRTVAQAGSSGTVCDLARQWAGSNPGFIEALNLPWGYAEPEWSADNLCGPLPVMGL